MSYKYTFQTAKSTILTITIFLFSLFFLPSTQEHFTTNKLYLLILSALSLLTISTIEIIVEKRIHVKKDPLDLLKIFFLISLILSVFVSPNKIQAFLNQNFGVVMIASLIIISFYLKRSNIIIMKVLSFSTIVLSLIAIIYFFSPFQKIHLPLYLQFLKNPFFTPLGSQLDLAIFLGFMSIAQLLQIIFLGKPFHNFRHVSSHHLVFLGSTITALILTIYLLLRGGLGQLPPFSYSWYSIAEMLKNPVAAILGVGIDNYATIFTKVKDVAYSQSVNWQLNSFNLARSTIFHIATEAGLLGLLTFLLVLFAIYKKGVKKNIALLIPMIYVTIILLFFPPSITLFFLFFIAMTVLDEESRDKKNILEIDLVKNPGYFIVPVFILITVLISSYLLVRAYAAEYYFKKSVDGLLANNARTLYDNQRQSIVLNPFIERFRINFSQTNLLIANNLASKANQQQNSNKETLVELSPHDRQTITQAIQTAIEEAKAAVTLNPQKATNWENLAIIYRNLINIAQGSDTWAIASFQRAIVLDPQNPQYRLNLGGIYYSLGNYDEAVRFFEQAVALKPDLPNAQYNLAWGLFQKKDYQKAYDQMQNLILLLDPIKDVADLKRAQSDLEKFKAQLPKDTSVGVEPTPEPPPAGQLNLPSPPPATLEPKLELSTDASPEAGGP